jgi:hypothetical protein
LKPSLPPCSPWSPPKLSNNFHPWIEKRKKKEKKREIRGRGSKKRKIYSP